MNIVFVGSTSFGLKCMEAVRNLIEINIVGVISIDKQFKISYSENGVTNYLYEDFETYSKEHDLPFYKLKKNMNEAGVVDFLEKHKPDFVLVAGWYHLVPENLLLKYRFGGLHASLLPDYSGGAPLVWAIINGESKTGITFFLFDTGVDSGDIIGQKEVIIGEEDTIKTLYQKIEIEGIKLLVEYLPEISNGTAKYIKQDDTKRRTFPQRSPADGEINWDWDARRIKNFIRAQTKPYPGAFTTINNKKVIIWDADIFDL